MAVHECLEAVPPFRQPPDSERQELQIRRTRR
jgi:hypothetical protein